MSVTPLVISMALAHHVSVDPSQFFAGQTWMSEAINGSDIKVEEVCVSLETRLHRMQLVLNEMHTQLARLAAV